MPTAEKINTNTRNNNPETDSGGSHERESGWQSDSLRHSLLAASEGRGGFVMIPRDTIMVEMNSNTIQSHSFEGLSHLVEDVQQEPALRSARGLRERGFGKLGMGNFMSSIDSQARHDLNHDQDMPNLSLLYDGANVDVDGETLIPSAVLIHEDLSELQIKELRDKFPAGVPFINGRTNELLDEVGQAEREEGRRNSRLNLGFGFFAVEDTVENSATSPKENRNRAYRTFDWEAAEDEFDDDAGDWDEDVKTVPQAVPESPEVQAHARAQEIIAEKTGGRDWNSLDDAEQRSVRRQVVRETHPDREGGDANVFRAAQDSMDLKSREKHG